MSRELAIVYAEGLTIQDPSLLASLALFYDKVYLPHPYELDPACQRLMRWSKIEHIDDLEMVQTGYVRWKESVKPLLESGAIEVLPAPLDVSQGTADLSDRLREKLGIQVGHFSRSQVFDGKIPLAMHALFGAPPAPDFLLARPGDTSTEHLRSVLATSLLLDFAAPKLAAMPPQEIVKLRASTGSERQGIQAYVDAYLDDVESRLAAAGGDREAAQRTIDREIRPKWVEYRAQRWPKVIAGVFRGVKHVAGAIEAGIKMMFVPADPKNYVSLAKIGAAAGEDIATAVAARRTNERRAHRFLSAVGVS